MKRIATFVLTFGIAPLCWAATPAPGSRQCAFLNRLPATAGSPSASVIALGLLERVAMGRGESIDPEIEKQIGVAAGELEQPVYKDPYIRGCAFRVIGESGIPGSVGFLKSLKTSDVSDATQKIWPSVEIALEEALMGQTADPASKIEFLKNVLTERHDLLSGGALEDWAVDELCNRGAVTALPQIRTLTRRLRSGQPGDDEIAFCEARMQVVARDPDRARALGSVFGSIVSLENTPEGKRLIQWAMLQFIALHSASADAELERIAGDLAVEAKNFPKDDQLSETKEFIVGILSARRK